MVTNDKPSLYRGNVDDNINTRDQRRVGIWFLVVTVLTIGGLLSLGDSHAPGEQGTQQQDMAGASGNYPVDVNPPDYSVNRPVGVIEWPGMVGKPTKYLTGQGNSPVENGNLQQGVSPGVSPDTATDEQSRKKATSGSTASDAMTPPSAEHAKANNSGLSPTGVPAQSTGVPAENTGNGDKTSH
jgi:hypothetical protein